MVIGSTISHYKIVEKLGEGGMGVVYKAEDTKLERTVALKFLAPHLVSNGEIRKRFIREAKTSAALQHPNICTVYEIGEADGHTFIAMACLDGRELADEIAEGALERKRALGLAIQFAEGLSEAHSKGVVHRDIKPANLFVTSAVRGVILDFGLAQLASADSKLTREGSTLGTCAYMSPEQATGTEVDARTDVWALGCVLYEMLSGRPPFRGHYDQAIVYSILNEDPEPIEAVDPNIDAVIKRCLAKDPSDRYEDGKALGEALRELQPSPRPSSGTASTLRSEIPRLAVLPFRTSGSDAELASFGEGLTEEITTGLAQFRHLSIVAAAAAARFQGPADVSDAGRQLDARFLLEGSIRNVGSRIRVNAQLVDIATGAHIWAERLDRDLEASDIFEVQDELTDRIVAAVAETSGVLTRTLVAFVKTKPIESLTAREAVLRMFGYWQTLRREEYPEVQTALEHALDREPNHVDALACLALLYIAQYRWNYNPRPNPLARAFELAQRAVELDPSSALAHRAVAETQYHRRNLAAFRAGADRAIALNARDTTTVAMLGALIAFSGDWEGGCSLVRLTMDQNPRHWGFPYSILAWDYYRKFEYQRAVEAAERVNQPGNPFMNATLAASYAQLGRMDLAQKHLERFTEIVPAMAQNPRAEWSKWSTSEEFLEHLLDGLRKAGLKIEARTEATD